MTTVDAASAGPHTRRQRVTAPLLLAGGVLGLSVLLHLRDPHQSGSWGYCPWLLLTGAYCPGCGGLRAVNDLTQGDLAAAASANLMLVGAIPVAVGLWGRSLADRWRGVVRRVEPRRQLLLALLVLVVALAFAVVRNTGPGAWLAP